jgi:hypothetical protein
MNQGTEIQQQFYKELKELLTKYGAEIAIQDVGTGYISDKRMIVGFMYSERYTVPQLDLGVWEDGTV